MWINTDLPGQPSADKAFVLSLDKDGKKTWAPQPYYPAVSACLDLSLPFVRELILEDLKQKAEKHFTDKPDALFIFGTEPEDGGIGYDQPATRLHNKNWYPDYLQAEGLPFGAPYALHGFKGLNQSTLLAQQCEPEQQGETRAVWRGCLESSDTAVGNALG